MAINARLMGSPPWFFISFVPGHCSYIAAHFPAMIVSSGPSFWHRNENVCLGVDHNFSLVQAEGV